MGLQLTEHKKGKGRTETRKKKGVPFWLCLEDVNRNTIFKSACTMHDCLD